MNNDKWPKPTLGLVDETPQDGSPIKKVDHPILRWIGYVLICAAFVGLVMWITGGWL